MPLLAEDQEVRANKAELNYWHLLTRNLDVERALQEAMQRVDIETRMVPMWIRDIAGGEEGIEGFDKLRECVEYQKKGGKQQTRAGTVAPVSPAG